MPRKKMHFILLFTFIFALLFSVSGCVEEVFVDELIRPDASVRFIQADANAGTVTFSIYGREAEGELDVVKATATVDYQSVSGYSTIPAGTRKIRIQSAEGTTETQLTINADYQVSLTLFNGGVSSLYERYKYSDEAGNLNDGQCAIRFRNFTNAATAFTIVGLGNTASVAAGATVGYLTTIPPGSHTITAHSAAATVDCTIAAKTRYTVVLFGTVDNPVVKVFTDDGK